MALGKITTVDADPTTGTVTEIETDDVYPYNDPLFAQKGLGVGDTITFDIDYESEAPYTVTNLQKYVPSERIINGPVTGPITSAAGETIRVKKGGKITGGVIITNNSSFFVEDDGAVEGNVTVGAGSNATIRKGGNVKGNVNINNGSLLRIVNKGVVKGNIVFSSGNKLIIGNDNGGGTVTGSITTDKIRKLSITATSVINCGA